MLMVVFEVRCGMKKHIRLSEVQWAHISSKHPELLEQVERMQMTLRQPDLVYHSPGEDNF